MPCVRVAEGAVLKTVGRATDLRPSKASVLGSNPRGDAILLLGGLRLKKFILYLIRWQLSTPILFICLSFLHLGMFWNTIISNLIGGCIFFLVDKKIFKN